MSSGQKAIKYAAICLAIFIILSIINGIFWGVSLLGSTTGSTKDFKESYNNVSKVKIDVATSKLSVIVGTEFKVEASGVSSRFSSKVTANNTLKIEERGSWFWHPKDGSITITVPKNALLEELDIDCGAGQVEVSDITSEKLDLDAGAGLLVIHSSNFAQVDLDGGAGKIEITNSILHNLDLDAGVGKVDISGEVMGKSKIECGIGEVSLRLGRKDDYRLRIEKGLGNIEIDGETFHENTTFGTGTNTIDIEGGIGNIEVDFQNQSF